MSNRNGRNRKKRKTGSDKKRVRFGHKRKDEVWKKNPDKKQIERFIAVLLLVCFVVCLVAIYQIPADGRASAPFEGPHGEPNTLGGYLVLMLSIVLGLLLKYGSAAKKAALGMLALFILIALAATLSRTSWLALLPMMLTLVYIGQAHEGH